MVILKQLTVWRVSKWNKHPAFYSILSNRRKGEREEGRKGGRKGKGKGNVKYQKQIAVEILCCNSSGTLKVLGHHYSPKSVRTYFK